MGEKDGEISLLKEHLGMLALKAGKLEEMLKSKDKEIEEMVNMIKAKKIA